MLKQQHHQTPSPSQLASSMTRRGKLCRRSPDKKIKTTRKHNIKEDRMLRALEAIRLLSFDTTEKPKTSSPSTPKTVTTLLSDDATADESNEGLMMDAVDTSKMFTLRPLPLTDRNSSGGTNTNSAFLRSDSNVSYLSSDTSSEFGDRLLSLEDEEEYPMYISFSRSSGGGCCDDHHNTSSSSRNSCQLQLQQTNSRRLSTTALEEWNRRCDEEDGVLDCVSRREKYASDMLNLNLNQFHRHHDAENHINRRNSCPVSPILTDLYGHWDASYDGTDDDDISLTYSHDE